MKIRLIVAHSNNRVIGSNNTLPFRQSADLQRFKTLTTGSTIIMGRKTFESLPGLLPGRNHIVISRTLAEVPTGVTVVRSLEDAFDTAKLMGLECWVIGGGEIYKQAMNYVDEIYATLVNTDIEGDTYFPDIDSDTFNLSYSTGFPSDSRNEHSYTFQVYSRSV